MKKFESIIQSIEDVTDEQLRNIHEALHQEAWKRGIRLSNISSKNKKDDNKGPFKSIEQL